MVLWKRFKHSVDCLIRFLIILSVLHTCVMILMSWVCFVGVTADVPSCPSPPLPPPSTPSTCPSSVVCGCMSSARCVSPSQMLESFNVTLFFFFFFSLLCFVYALSLFLSPGEVLFQMAEVHRQIQIQLEEMVSMWCMWCCCWW